MTFVAVPFLVNRGPLHGHKLGTIFAIVGAIVSTGSGFLCVAFLKRVLGVVHALPMLGISGYCLYGSVPFLLNPRGLADNPAAGVIGWDGIGVVAANGVGALVRVSASMLTSPTLDWCPCECFLEQRTLARAGWGKSPCPVRRGRGAPLETDNCGRFNSSWLSSLLYWNKAPGRPSVQSVLCPGSIGCAAHRPSRS